MSHSEKQEKALEIIDSAQAIGNMSDFSAELCRAQILSRSSKEQRQDSARTICMRMLEHDSVKNDLEKRFNVLDLLVYISRMQHDDEQCLHWASSLADVCRKQGDEITALRTESEIGMVMTHLGQTKKGLDMLNNAIARLEQINSFNALDSYIIASKRKMNVLYEMEVPDEIIPQAQHILQRLSDYEQWPAKYHDNSYREPNEDKRADYIAFYRAQAHGFMALAYAAMGDLREARHYCNLFEQSEHGKSFNGRRLIAPVWCALGDYDKMLFTFDEVQRRMGTDTMNVEYLQMLKYRAIVANELGRQMSSQNFWQRYAALARKLHDQLMASRALEYSTRYHLQESQAQLKQKEADVRHDLLIAAASFIFFVIAVGFAIYFYRQKRIIGRKNSVIVEQMAQAIKYKEKLLNMSQTATDPHDDTATPVPNTPALTGSELNTLSDKDLFLFLSSAIERDRVYLNSDFGRQTLADIFHISNHRIGSAFSRGSQYQSLPKYIREIRLQYASELLLSRPSLTVSEVASASGFANVSVFNRDFKNKFTVSPSEYRNLRAATSAEQNPDTQH